MPNWCSNSVTVSHPDPAQIQRFNDAFNKGELFQEFVPCPQELLDGDGWYDWCVTNWGTKWDIQPYGVELNENDLRCSFDTAWAPPLAFYHNLAAQGFEVSAMYYEPGMNFCGSYEVIGEDIMDDYYDIPGTCEGVVEQIPQAIDECFGISDYVAECEEMEREDD